MRTARLLDISVIAIVCVRIATTVWAAAWNTQGDFYASLPGTYVKWVNPTLWDSPDMRGAWGYHRDTYFHGPTQYLTLYPIAFLDSYEQIAWALLPVYILVIAVAWVLLYRALAILAPGRRIAVPLFAATFLFFPLLQAFIQREFEVVIFLGLAFALLQVMRDRLGVAGAAFAYVAWFKYIPLMLFGYVVLRGWTRAAMAFVAASIAILTATHVVFGLDEFYNNNVPSHAAQVFRVFDYSFYYDAGGVLNGDGFCKGWFETETTLANLRHGLCAVAARAPMVPPNVVYLLICIAVAVAYLVTHVRLARRVLDESDERWRRAIELSIIITICSCFFFAHYYYLSALTIPVTVLLIRFLDRDRRPQLAVWAVAFVLLSGFVVPTGIVSRLTGADVWAWYVGYGWWLYGELLLIALLMHEYWALAARPAPAAAQPAIS
ncbi:MAG TPA: glycosyltransferase 87 family protein [Vicinamibacterales bacterium]|nr:glycosyltransferase 87 family protein [Vicinamibacterales bacterium]